MAIQTGCLGALHGSQSLTALNQWGMLIFIEEYYLECFKSYDIYKKMKKMSFSLLSHLLLYTKTHRDERWVLIYPMLNSHCNTSSSH